MVVDKDQINAPYMQKWRSKGIRVITSPVNRSLERLYFEKQLRLTCMADTMDEIGIDKLLEDNWTYVFELTTCFQEFSEYKSTNLLTNISPLKKKTTSLLAKKSFFSQFWALENQNI